MHHPSNLHDHEHPAARLCHLTRPAPVIDPHVLLMLEVRSVLAALADQLIAHHSPRGRDLAALCAAIESDLARHHPAVHGQQFPTWSTPGCTHTRARACLICQASRTHTHQRRS